MEYKDLLALVGEEPLFESSLLLAGDVDPHIIRLQLARWKRSGKIYQLRRGLYTLASPYQKVHPHPFLVVNRLRDGSYVSCETALAYYGMIPEIVHETISVTGGRPGTWKTPLGVYRFHHIKPSLLRGYRLLEVAPRQQALVATPEKALLDLVYLQPGGETQAYLDGLRLENLHVVNPETLQTQAQWFDSPKMYRAVDNILAMRSAEEEYKAL